MDLEWFSDLERIWKGFCGLEIVSLDLEGSGDLEGIWKGFLGFGAVSVHLEEIRGGSLVKAGIGNLLEKGAATSLFRDY